MSRPEGRAAGAIPRGPSTLLVLPAVLVVLVAFGGPFLLLAALSFASQPEGSLVADLSRPTLANYARLLGDGFYLRVLATTVGISALATLGCLALALPLAHWLARHAGRWRRVASALVLVPLACGALLPTLGLAQILGPLGVVNGTLRSLGLVDRAVPLMGTYLGVLIGLVQAFLPFAVLPILAVLDRTPAALEDAAMSLGASRGRVWTRVILPLAAPGIAAGGLLVFCSALTAFVTPQVIGQGRIATFSTLAYQQALQVLDWPFASALAMTMLAVLALAALLAWRLGPRRVST